MPLIIVIDSLGDSHTHTHARRHAHTHTHTHMATQKQFLETRGALDLKSGIGPPLTMICV